MKNVMKKLAGLLMVLSVALFAGCSDSSDRANEAPQTAKTYTVSGKISIGNAVPETVAKSIASASEGASSNARTATTSFDKITCGSTKWEVKATNNSGAEIYGEVNSEAEEILYSINLPTDTWDLELSLLGETDTNTFEALLYYEEKELEVPGDSERVAVIFLSPKNFSTNINGALDLTITDGTEEHKIKSVSCSLEYLTRKDSADAPMDENFKEKLATVIASLKEPKEFSSGEVKIECNDIPAGCYEATFTFKASGNKLYVCKENITVFSGWKTDTWLGEGAHLKNVDEVTKFEIADVDLFDVENVPDTNLIVFNCKQPEGGGAAEYEYYPIEKATSEISNENKITPKLNSSAIGSPIPNFAFDAAGNMYFASYETEPEATAPAWKIICRKTDGTSSSIPLPSSINDSKLYLTIDTKTNVLYAMYGFQMDFTIYKFPSLISDGNTDDYRTIPSIDFGAIDASCYHDNDLIVINDDVVYGWNKYKKALYKVDLNAGASSLVAEKIPFPSSDYLCLKNYYTVTDILYQDEAVYLLVRDKLEDNSPFTRGALIRYDMKFGGVKVLGLTNNKLEKEDFASAKLGVYYNNSPVLNPPENEAEGPIVFDCNDSWEYDGSDKYLFEFMASFATPVSLSAEPDLTVKEFFGPVKFIAIKPKRLVIADDGIAFYTDNDLLKYKNVNRIVTVDLESFSIIEASLVKVFFNGDDSDVKTVVPIPNTGSTDSQDLALIAGRNAMLPAEAKAEPEGTVTTLSYLNTKGDSVDRSAVIFGIPCGDGE